VQLPELKDWCIMDPSAFIFIVLPLGVMVFLLVGGIVLIVKRDEIARKRSIKSTLKEETKHHELMEKQLCELSKMYKTESINADTYKRLKILVRMNEEPGRLKP